MKNISIVNNIKIQSIGHVSTKKLKSYEQIKLETCIDLIEKKFRSNGIKIKMPSFYLTSHIQRDINVIFDKILDKFYVNNFFIKTKNEKLITNILLDSLSIYINNKLNFNKKIAIKELYFNIIKNKKIFKEGISGNNLVIPSGKFNGIMIPKIPLNTLNEFSNKILSLYLKGTYPKNINNKRINEIVNLIKDIYGNINI